MRRVELVCVNDFWKFSDRLSNCPNVHLKACFHNCFYHLHVRERKLKHSRRAEHTFTRRATQPKTGYLAKDTRRHMERRLWHWRKGRQISREQLNKPCSVQCYSWVLETVCLMNNFGEDEEAKMSCWDGTEVNWHEFKTVGWSGE